MTNSESGKLDYIRLDHDILRSETWAGLSSGAVVLLIAILDRFNGTNNGEMHYSVKDAMTCLHCGNKTAIRRFAELQEVGMIERTNRASFANKEGARRGMSSAWRVPFLDRDAEG